MQEIRVWSLGQEEPLKKEMATHSSILAWEVQWTEEPGGLRSMGLQRIGQDLETKPPPDTAVEGTATSMIHHQPQSCMFSKIIPKDSA